MQRAYWIIVIVLLLLTRAPAAAQYLSIDNVNLAFGLENFDPLKHQPQPPGYPFFIGFARVVNIFFHDADTTFFVISILITGLCLPVIVALGDRFMNRRVGQTAALLLLFAPPFWLAGLVGPLRPNLALFSLLTAYCSWRAWNGEARFVVWGALALGIGSGFRPDLLGYLLPLWLISAVVGTRSVKAFVQGALALAGVVFLWVASLAFVTGGFGQLYQLNASYLADQSTQGSVLAGVAAESWQRQISRLVIWNGLAAIGWLWAVPFALATWDKRKPQMAHILFIIAWVAPGILFQAVVHSGDPGHTLFSVPAICLVGACAIWKAAEWVASSESVRVVELATSSALVLNLLLFMNYFPLPAVASPGFLGRLKDAVLFGAFESSVGNVRWLDDISRVTMKEFHELAPADRPSIIVSEDVHQKAWFMNWRIVRYYAADTDIWVIATQNKPKTAFHVRREKTLDVRTADVVDVPVPSGGRIIWLLERGGQFDKALASLQPRETRQYLSATDVLPNTPGFRVLEFNFVPTAEE